MTSVAALLLAALWTKPSAGAEPVSLRSEDGWRLEASYTKAGRKEKGCAVALFHGLDSSKEEWSALAAALRRKGVSTLAVDLRGHGKSSWPYGPRPWRSFRKAEEWEAMRLDVKAALEHLLGRGHKPLGLGGASLGAFVALDSASRFRDVRFAASISVVEVGTGEIPSKLGRKPVLFAFSLDDAKAVEAGTAWLERRRAAGLADESVVSPSGHGVAMFSDRKTLGRVADWIASQCRK